MNLFAQDTQGMSCQAVIRNACNNLVVSSPICIQISILQGLVTNTAVYIGIQTSSNNANGLLNIEIGTGTIGTVIISSINWAIATYFLKTETEITGGTNYNISGTNQLLSVPFSQFTTTSGNGGSGPIVVWW